MVRMTLKQNIVISSHVTKTSYLDNERYSSASTFLVKDHSFFGITNDYLLMNIY